ncbi:MAG: helix-turn-helix domain-containing protein, partial [Synechocystis sp.]
PTMTRRNGKMTLTFNPEKYQSLLLTYQPKIIRSESENEKALQIVETLMHRHDRSPEEDELYELLIMLIEKFEQEYYPIPPSDPNSLFFFLLEQRGLTPQTFANASGFETHEIEDLINGAPDTYRQQSQRLGDFFSVDPSLFWG